MVGYVIPSVALCLLRRCTGRFGSEDGPIRLNLDRSIDRVKHLTASRPYVGLNALFSDGEKLYAYCKYHEEDESRRSLGLGDQPVFQMSYLASSTRLVVSSEKTNREDDWRSLKSGQLLVGQIKDGGVCLDFEDIK